MAFAVAVEDEPSGGCDQRFELSFFHGGLYRPKYKCWLA